MFQNLTDFAMRRSAGQAFGFWLLYMILGILISGIAGGIAGAFKPGQVEAAIQAGLVAGSLAATLYVAAISVIICFKKALPAGFYIVAALGPLIALFGGGVILGLIPAAFLTTRGEGAGTAGSTVS